MSLTKVLNSKSNIKQYSGADLPTIPRQPVIARMTPVESTNGQTVINLPFSIDTVNAPEVLLAYVDGKLLTPGSLNDFTFTSIDSFGYSSQITLTVPLVAGLNIQAIKLGLKKETEFVQDARFNDVYESQGQGFQGFVKTSDLMTATSATGTPAAGTFHSTVQNRSAMVDMSKDLKARMGIERINIMQLQYLPGEMGVNGEPVYSSPGDLFNQMRFVGQWSFLQDNNQGSHAQWSVSGDFLEITFFGTGLNLLTVLNNFARDWRVSVDGQAEGGNVFVQGQNILTSKNYPHNQILNVASGLSQGVHTVRVRNNSAAGGQFYGFEILNEVQSLKINQGSAYIGGKKLNNVSQVTSSFNSTFESGSLGSRGGRVLVYQKADGSIAKAVTPTDASQLNLSSANHVNEEIARTLNWREFGSSQSSDFSLSIGATSDEAFTLDDGTTTLVGQDVRQGNSSSEGDVLLPNAANAYITITFVGTGLDIIRGADIGSGSMDSNTILVDGSSIGGLPSLGIYNTAGYRTNQKIVSGLPYGTHTVRFMRNNVISSIFTIAGFKVYQPKKPALPSGAVELADYNVMATFSDAGLTTDNLLPPVGALFKSCGREFLYRGSGTWGFDTQGQLYQGHVGQSAINTSNGAIFEYTFVGTGIVLMFSSNSSGTKSYSISIDGVANASGSVFGGATNGGGGAYTIPVGSSLARWISFQGLSYGKHTITVQCTDATGFNILFLGAYINPGIHSHKDNQYLNSGRASIIGSNCVSDNRMITPVKESVSKLKFRGQSEGIVSDPSTTSTVLVPMADMTMLVPSKGGRFAVEFNGTGYNSSTAVSIYNQIFVNGLPSGKEMLVTSTSANSQLTHVNRTTVDLPPGIHKVEVFWRVDGGTGTMLTTRRVLTVTEI